MINNNFIKKASRRCIKTKTTKRRKPNSPNQLHHPRNLRKKIYPDPLYIPNQLYKVTKNQSSNHDTERSSPWKILLFLSSLTNHIKQKGTNDHTRRRDLPTQAAPLQLHSMATSPFGCTLYNITSSSV